LRWVFVGEELLPWLALMIALRVRIGEDCVVDCDGLGIWKSNADTLMDRVYVPLYNYRLGPPFCILPHFRDFTSVRWNESVASASSKSWVGWDPAMEKRKLSSISRASLETYPN
jgi:hypothetical protein